MSDIYSLVPALNTGDTISASWWNTYLKTNMAALWKYAAAGDMLQAISATEVGKVSKPSALSVATMDASGVLTWILSTETPGMLHAAGMTTWENDQSIGPVWTNVTNGVVTLTLTKACKIFVVGGITGFNALRYSAGGAYDLRVNINGVADSSFSFNGGITGGRNEALPWLALATGVPAGSRAIQLQAQMEGETDNIAGGRLLAMAFVEIA